MDFLSEARLPDDQASADIFKTSVMAERSIRINQASRPSIGAAAALSHQIFSLDEVLQLLLSTDRPDCSSAGRCLAWVAC